MSYAVALRYLNNTKMKNPSLLKSAGGFAVRRFRVEAGEVSSESASRTKVGRAYRKCLYDRLCTLDPTEETVSEVLNQYREDLEGKQIERYELTNCVKGLIKYQKFDQALQVQQWMKKRGIDFLYSDYKMRIVLLSEIHGIAAAEDYFNALEVSKMHPSIYGALLTCYCKNKMTEQAMIFFRKLERMGLGSTMNFNSLISLYMQTDQPEKVSSLIKEMKKQGLSPTTYTYNCWMHSCARSKDMKGVERVIQEMRKRRKIFVWSTYSNLADIYVNSGLLKKADWALRKLEQMKSGNRMAYHFLLSLYAKTSNIKAVIRVCDSLKSDLKMTNKSRLILLHSFARLGAVDELTKCYEEWASQCTLFDMRFTNVTIKAYLESNMVEEAKRVLQFATDRSLRPSPKPHELFMEFFLRQRNVELAFNHLESAALVPEWEPNLDSVREFFTCFQEKKDVEGAEKLCRVLKRVRHLDSNGYRWLNQVYLAAGRKPPEMHGRVVEGGIEVNSELQNSTKTVSTNNDDLGISRLKRYQPRKRE